MNSVTALPKCVYDVQSVFDYPTEVTDITLEVEGRKLHVNKGVLSTASPVFQRMFHGDFKEKHATNIPLPGKSFDEIMEMLLCIYPSEMKAITKERVDVLLKLADEYEMAALKRKCEQFLLSQCESVDGYYSKTELVHYMLLADKYDLVSLLEKTTDIASKVTFKGRSYGKKGFRNTPIAGIKEYGVLSEKTTNLYLSKRVYHLEKTYEID